jgi:thiol:disulfide interchange protein DsbA
MFGRLIAAVLLVALSGLALAQAPQQGKDYFELSPPQATDAPGKIEVLEFFWYGCPHCYNLEPLVEAWAKKLPDDVVFRRVPAVFNQNWEAAARAHYTLEAMGLLDKLHKPFFDAIHKDSLRYTSQTQLEAWLTKNGVEPEKFAAAAKAFSVESKVRRAVQLTNAYKFDGVPAMTVQGRFVVGAQSTPSRQLTNVDYFVDVVRKELAIARPAAKEQPKEATKAPAKK